MTDALPSAVCERFYRSLGPLSRTRKVETGASNAHFVVEASGGRYFLKQISHPDALYEGSGVDRLRVVCEAIRDLRAVGLPVEELVATDSGDLLAEHEGSVFRLYRFIEGRAYDESVADLRRAATALGRLHAEGLKALGTRTATELAAFETPYPLGSTSRRLDELSAFLSRRAGLEVEDDLRAALALIEGLSELSSTPALAHLDFHPGNLLFLRDEVVILDLDNMMLEDPLKCAGLAILRFAFRDGNPSRERLLSTWRQWAAAYEPASDIALDDRVLRWMASIELEKILRIASRVETTGHYERFLENIARRHLPNLRLVVSIAGSA